MFCFCLSSMLWHVVIFFFFFFNDTATTEIYTSFPTRRSSDLKAAAESVRVRARAVAQQEVERAEALRSEEHTSELQSRRDLVCRLLLEKKKKKSAEAIWSQITDNNTAR